MQYLSISLFLIQWFFVVFLNLLISLHNLIQFIIILVLFLLISSSTIILYLTITIIDPSD